MTWMRVVTFAVLLACASPLPAQELYFSGGWSQVWREPPWAPSLATPAAPPAAAVQTATMGMGLWLDRHLGVEGSIGLHGEQTVPWKWRYLFGGTATDQIAFDRDVPIAGTVRLAPLPGHRVSVEPFVGGGINLHRSRSYITADCGPASMPTTCVPVTPHPLSDSLTSAEWLLTCGADVPIRASRRVEIVPGVRVMFVKRRQYLTGYNHRGPVIGGGRLPGFGVNVRYALRDR